ncbi:MAG: hypothetical protein ABIH65_04135 [Nanoarchaeota archaeon]
MRKNEIKGIIHDLLNISEWRNPLAYASLKNKVTINLIKGDVLGVDEDDIHKLYHEKIDWFKKTIKKRGAKLIEFEKAVITIVGAKEKIEITFRGETFTGELVH